jgi:uncharacterized protein
VSGSDATIIDPATCESLLAGESTCRVGFVADDSELHILPVTHAVVDGNVCFRSAPGSKLGQAAAGGRMVVQADAADAAGQTGWSVLGRGVAQIVTDPADLEILLALPFEPWAQVADDGFWVRIVIDRWTGRRFTH